MGPWSPLLDVYKPPLEPRRFELDISSRTSLRVLVFFLSSAKMTSLYDQTIPVFTKYLRNMSALLEKGRIFAEEKGMSHEEFLQFRLIHDMRPWVPSTLTDYPTPCSPTPQNHLSGSIMLQYR